MTNDNASDTPTRDLQTFTIIGAAMEVHTVLGSGFIEPVYRRPLMLEFAARTIPYVAEVRFPIIYKGQPTGVHYRADFLCYGEVIVELKAVRALTPVEEAQTLNYLKASGKKRALLLNFGSKSLQYRRFVN